jgi:predicted tellurium resistance membrane protein TerC
MEWITDPAIWASLFTLTLLEIVLGIDNVIFVSIVANKLPESQRASARRIGLSLALILRLLLLSMLVWLVGLTNPLFTVFGQGFSWRDLILLSGGIFLIYKGTREILDALDGETEDNKSKKNANFATIIAQIIVLDLVFSIDSVVTAIGMAEHLWVMITAVVIAMGVMLSAAKTISDFINQHPTAKMLALAFLLLVGVALVADGLHFHIPREYLYVAIAFSVLVEILNFIEKRKRNPKISQG